MESKINSLFALHTIQSVFFRPHQIVTYMFLHGGFMHILFNMFALFMFGSTLENYWGPKRFLTFYVVSGIGAAIFHLAVLYYQNGHLLQEFYSLSPDQQLLRGEYTYGMVNTPTLGASGAVFGCLAAFGYLFPNSEMIILPIPFPVKAKWVVIGYAAIELFSGIRDSAGDNVAHWAHLGGGLVGLLLVIFWNRDNRKNFY
ncbi:rhomboid family intramembrane serine protease [Flavitalea flava]